MFNVILTIYCIGCLITFFGCMVKQVDDIRNNESYNDDMIGTNLVLDIFTAIGWPGHIIALSSVWVFGLFGKLLIKWARKNK